MWSAVTEAAAVLWFLPETQTALAPTPALGPFVFGFGNGNRARENPFERTATVAEILRL